MPVIHRHLLFLTPLLLAGLVLLLQGPAPAADEKKADLYGDPLPPHARLRLGTVRLRHAHCLSAAAFSPDGKLVATADSGAVIVWETRTGKQVLRLPGNDPRLSFSPDGKTLALASLDRKVHLWDMKTGRELRCLMPKERDPDSWNSLESVAFSPDGKLLAAGDSNKAVTVWDLSTGRESAVLLGHEGRVEDVAFLPGGKSLVSGSRCHNTTRLWDLTGAKELRKFPGYFAGLTADGGTLATRAPDGIHLWEPMSGKELRHLPAADSMFVRGVALSPDGSIVASEEPDEDEKTSAIFLRDTRTGKVLRDLGRGPVLALTFSSDGKVFAAAGVPSLRLWDVTTGKRLCNFPAHEHEVRSVAFSPDGRRLVSGGNEGTCRIWDISTGKELCRREGLGNYFDWAVFAPDGKSVAVEYWDRGQHFRRLDADSGNDRPTPSRSDNASAVACSADGKLLALAQDEYPKVGNVLTHLSVWDVQAGNTRWKTVPSEHQILSAAAFSPTEDLLATGGHDGYEKENEVRLWDVQTGQEEGRMAGHTNWVNSVTFSRDGRLLTSASADGTVRIWEVLTRSQVYCLRGNELARYPVAFSPDGVLLAAARNTEKGERKEAGSVNVWAVASGEEIGSFVGHIGQVSALAFSPDGRLLASGGEDTTILLWDVAALQRDKLRPAPKDLSDAEMDRLWDKLGSADAAAAHKAIWGLVAGGDKAAAFLGGKLRPVPKADAAQLRRRIAELDNEDFDVRQRATDELAKIGAGAEGALHAALADSRSEEVRRRAAQLLEELRPAKAAGRLRALRAVEVLERLDTRKSRAVLETLADGERDARLTREARAALARLAAS